MFSISLSSSSVHSLISNFSYSIPSFFFIISIIPCSLALAPFYHLQFLSSLAQYSLSYLLSAYSNSFLTINLSGNFPLLNVPFFFFCLQTSSISCRYSFSNSSTASFAFFKFFIPSQVLDSAMNPFHHTKYLSFPLIHCLFKILSTFHSSSLSIMTGGDCSFFCPSTCPTYFYILLIFTTGYILIVLGNSNLTAFTNTIFFTL